MSVIYGCMYFDGRPLSGETLNHMRTRLHHWNADDQGTWQKDHMGMGHLMLYNTPESLHEKLPHCNTHAGLTITADARIDNREEIIHRLQIRTTPADVFPDSILILMLYEKYGRDCVRYLTGDFAFAIWDERNQTLFCARDPMGVKPFFYYYDQHVFAFASEKKGLLAIPEVNKDIDESFLYQLLLWPVDYSDTATLYRHIKRLAPAHTLTVHTDRREFTSHRYWTLDVEKTIYHKRTEDYIEELQHHFETAVRCRLRSHYPIGAELSGGLDSSAITGVACAAGYADDLFTFSNTIPEDTTDENLLAYSERAYMEDVIRYHGIKNAVFITGNIWENPLDEIDFCLEVDDGLEAWDPLWQAPSKKAAWERHVRTLLSGFPGDQLVTNNGWHAYLMDRENSSSIRYFLGSKGYKDLNRRLWSLVPRWMEYGYRKTRNLYHHFMPKNHEPFVIPLAYRLRHGDEQWSHPYFRERFVSYRHFLRAALIKPRVGLRLEAETRHGLYFKLEPRFPMADIRLTQYYLSMPDELKVNGTISRETFRKAVRPYLPETVFLRDSKSGNVAPFKFNAEVNKKHQDIANEIALKVRNKIVKKLNKNTYISSAYLRVIRWIEK